MGMEFILKWHFSCRMWEKWSMISFISFTYWSSGNSGFDHLSFFSAHPEAEGDSPCSPRRMFLTPTLIGRVDTASVQKGPLIQVNARWLSRHELCPILHFLTGRWGRRMARPFKWSSSLWMWLITGQCRHWMLSKGLCSGLDCKIRGVCCYAGGLQIPLSPGHEQCQ